MDVHSLKRLITTIAGAAVLLLGKKLGLDASQQAMITTLLGMFLAQSGVNAALSKVAASKAGAEVQKALELGKLLQGAIAKANEAPGA